MAPPPRWRQRPGIDSGAAGKVRVLGVPDRFVRFGSPGSILAELGLDADGIVASVGRMLDTRVI